MSMILIFLYSSYFVIVAYTSIFSIKEMKKSYRFVIIMTFIVMCVSIIIMLLNGFTAASYSDTTMFVSLYALFNIYMYIIAYLYSPSIEGLEDLKYNKNRVEHEHIMSQFYESELPDISRDDDHKS